MERETGRAGRRRNGRRTCVAAVLGSLALAACGSDRGMSNASPEPRTRSDADASEVFMRLIAYQPQQLNVAQGTAVVWKQQDAGFHTVSSGTVDRPASGSVETKPDGTFDSGELAKGEDFTFTFAEEGAYEYFCKIHPATMSGRVTVA